MKKPGKPNHRFRLTVAKQAAVFCTLLSSLGTVHASSQDAWANYKDEVVSACVAASNLREAKPAGAIVEFDDGVGYSAVIIDGCYPQPHMKNQRGRVLCLFNKKTRTAFVSDADPIVSNRRP